MKIAMIAAMAKNRVIGLDNDMPWHLPDDLRFFKATTTGKPVVMGRKTFESIGSKPLPNRPNYVISRQADFVAIGATVFSSVDEALQELSEHEEVIIMGGGQLYNMMLPKADKLYLTQINADINGDTFFPDWTKVAWNELSRVHHQKDENHAFEFDFVTLERA
ncbi:type 3 dihydrofolate reductase [Thiomicrorhabdus lithotrophica]|uniref:Dihydrofolate reductase n=1 Tax=Thiomicrorhabdus lithotrophica TaxID=2949997 RepID=A0ABY8CBV3_9GAMM|nr:type 3 dihydrofolate reductase [Thiomicrorhabdus lithotrophica]WEJ62041.1 type 3 dihydrofolate reductase [Thiomicrorhabdus lithotrophica]